MKSHVVGALILIIIGTLFLLNNLGITNLSLTKVLVTSVSTGGSGGEDRLTENVSLNFAEVKFEYFLQNEKGVTASGGVFNWDIAANAAK